MSPILHSSEKKRKEKMLKDQKTHTMMFKFLARKFEEDTVKLL